MPRMRPGGTWSAMVGDMSNSQPQGNVLVDESAPGPAEISIDVPGAGAVTAILPRLTTTLPNGSVGYFQRRVDDCQRAAIATVLQVPYEEVPDWNCRPGTHADELADWAAIWDWARGLGYRVGFHARPPQGCTAYVALDAPDAHRMRHTVAVVDGHLFNPASGWRLPVGLALDAPGPFCLVVTFEKRSPA